MKKSIQFLAWPIFFGLVASIGVIWLKPELVGLESRNKIVNQERAFFSRWKQVSYSSAVKRAVPAVVNIFTKTTIDREGSVMQVPIHLQEHKDQDEISLGSGVIVNPDGYILTNNHVIEGAENITIAFNDGREAIASVVGIDQDTDLAVLKVSMNDLPSIHFADSRQADVGDVVLAIGNPFGLGKTVTMGIISAIGRNDLQLNTYEDFIQTDAAINIGNSGGALVDAHGDLVGICTLLFSRGGGSDGIGFAIPTDMARFVLGSIVEHGQVIRGWLGIESQPLNNNLAELYGVTINDGVLISGVYEAGPADVVGLRRGDILTSISGVIANDVRRVMNQVAQKRPGSEVSLTILRNGKEMSFKVRVGKRPKERDE